MWIVWFIKYMLQYHNDIGFSEGRIHEILYFLEIIPILIVSWFSTRNVWQCYSIHKGHKHSVQILNPFTSPMQIRRVAQGRRSNSVAWPQNHQKCHPLLPSPRSPLLTKKNGWQSQHYMKILRILESPWWISLVCVDVLLSASSKLFVWQISTFL